MTKLMTPFQRHVSKWHDCVACPLHKTRQNVVFCRGSLPADICFVGEAPGPSEDVIGKPFIGPAGELLDDIVETVLGNFVLNLRVCFTNLVCCIPLEAGSGSKFAEPPDESVRACRPRLEEFLKIARPRLIVAVGVSARDWFDKKRRDPVDAGDAEVIDIVHPAAILRASAAQQDMAIRRAAIQIAVAVQEVFTHAS